MIDYKVIESKWQKAWADAKIFEGEISNKKQYMVTAAFPYVNAPQHIGHLRTYGTADVLARYKRMHGLNVLYPMAFHATGTPVLAFAKRIRNGDEELKKELRMFHIPDEEIAKMTDPLYIANYFVGEIEKGMHLAGYSIDWRRKFVSIDANFSKLIEWQFDILNKKGYLIKGKHAVGWCPNENNAVGMHDTKHDVEPEIEAETAVKFKVDGEDAYLICATYRPETISGVTNLFVNQDSKYALCRIAGQEGKYYVSKGSIQTLSFQMQIDEEREVHGNDLLAKKCINPVTKAVIPVLPGFSVKDDVGTGLVMSVPAHAPFDYAAIEKLEMEGYDISSIVPIKVLSMPPGKIGGDIPALEYIKMAGALSYDENALEEATKLEYKDEFHFGIMDVEGFRGMKVADAKEKIKGDLIKSGDAIEIYELANESQVYCRCGSKVVVKMVDGQWFINYGDAGWKKLAKEVLSGVNVLPEKSRSAFLSALDWINLRAAERAQGLGTKFPYEKSHIIESLSDSTIYMSFYTISNLIRDVDPEKLTGEFFDYVMLGRGDAESVSKSTGVDFGVVRKCRDSFSYWYTNTSRHSAPELIFNHLTMYMFNHAAIFSKDSWPKQIVVNGTVLSEGEKMSKSLGNIVPLTDGLEKYGVDPLRFTVVAGADLFSDSEFSDKAVNGVKERFEYLFEVTGKLEKLEAKELTHMDYWLYSKLNRKIRDVTGAMEKLELRNASTNLLYSTVIELKRYFARGGSNAITVRDYLSGITLMMQPIAPHISEELWHRLGNDTFSSTEKWPSADISMISEKVEEGEDMLDSVIADAKQVIGLMEKKGEKKARSIRIIVAEDWKRDLQGAMAREKDMKKAMESLPDNLKEKGAKYAALLSKHMNELKEVPMVQEEEFLLLSESTVFLEENIGAKVEVEKEGESKSQRAGRAMPLKPSMDVS